MKLMSIIFRIPSKEMKFSNMNNDKKASIRRRIEFNKTELNYSAVLLD